MAFSSGQLVLDKPYFIGVQNAILFGCGYAGLCLGASAVNVEFAYAPYHQVQQFPSDPPVLSRC